MGVWLWCVGSVCVHVVPPSLLCVWVVGSPTPVWGVRPGSGRARVCVCRSERPRMDRRGVYAPGSRLPSVFTSNVLSWSACAMRAQNGEISG